jgi:hypothetical protein
VAVNCCVDFKDEGRKEDVHAHSMQAKKSAAYLTLLVSSETVKRVLQHRYVKTVSDENFLAVERDDGRPGTQNGRKQVVAHAYSST